MDSFQLLASPWWVNFLILIPLILFLFWKHSLSISPKTLLATGIFGIAFGFVEAAAVIYLREILSFLVFMGADANNAFHPLRSFQQVEILTRLPTELIRIEFFREAATIIMILAIAFLTVRHWRERWAIFFWVFAFWDIFYYVWLWVMIKWPPSLTTPDILFLIPVAWVSQVWFPLLVSLLVILGIFFSRKKTLP
jgi:hypothetical protein